MSFARSRNISVDKIPVINVSPLRDGNQEKAKSVGKEIRKAAEEVGFFYICNHGIPIEVIDKAYNATIDFFARPRSFKDKVKINSNHHGYLSIGETKMADAVKVDLKESFVWGLDIPDEHTSVLESNPFLGKNQWPEKMPELRECVYPFFEAGLKCGRDMMRAFALGMEIPEDSFLKSFNEPIARGSIIYYPPQSPKMGETQFGVSPHTDYGCLTLLWQDQVGGLELQTSGGEWVKAKPIKDTLVVNVGDLLMRWSNNIFKSTLHRVINRKAVKRHSMVIAWDPNFETVVDPSLVCQKGSEIFYPPVTCGEYILSRFDSSFNYRS